MNRLANLTIVTRKQNAISMKYTKRRCDNPSICILKMYQGMDIEYKNLDNKEHLNRLSAVGVNQAIAGQRIRMFLRPLISLPMWAQVILVRMQSDIYLDVAADPLSITYNNFRFKFEYASSKRRRDGIIEFRKLNAEQLLYLIQNGYDVFKLIDRKLAYKKRKNQ